MEAGTQVWVKCDDNVWIPGTVLGNVGLITQVRTEKDVVAIGTDEHNENVLVRNKISMPSTLSSLVKLKYLNEPDLLFVLQERFRDDLIYTYIGSALLAMNPFKKLNLCSDTEIARHYRFVHGSEEEISSLPPHVFSVAVKALFGLRNHQTNQSILVSGESGSGKTETTKILMRFLAYCSHSTHCDASTSSQPSSEIGMRILQTNPILESFGNARTIRNDNSSRFGKFITLYFGPQNELVGSTMCSYLLENVRIVYQSSQECNFHVFYELLYGSDPDLRGTLGLDLADSYQLTNIPTSNGFLSDGFSSRFQETCHALERNGVNQEERNRIFAILGALLHLGNVDFERRVDDSSSKYAQEDRVGVSATTRKHLVKSAELFGVESADLTSVILTREIHAGNDVLSVELSCSQAKDVCRSVVKLVYSRMFSWLVQRLGEATAMSESVRVGSMSISILDIFGFEDLNSNRFEQLCINYANERLQAQFNEFVFEKEQEAYDVEGIRWQSIPFPSNEACVQLFDDKMTGLFCLLDEECRIPGGSNQSLAAKYYKQHGEDYTAEIYQRSSSNDDRRDNEMTRSFSASNIHRARTQFVVNHFAGRVRYELKQFLERNVDAYPDKALVLFKSSSNPVLSKLASAGAPSSSNHGIMRAPSVSAQFRNQLDVLMLEIAATQAHYIRCIKSNDRKGPDLFDRKRVVEQLRSVGVLEAVRIARTGFQVRLSHIEFVELFLPVQQRLSSVDGLRTADRRTQCCLVAAALLVTLHRARHVEFVWSTQCSYSDFNIRLEEHGVQIGRTMVFCREDIYREFSQLRNNLRTAAATTIAAWVRQLFQESSFRRVIAGFVRLQAAIRGRYVRKTGVLAVIKFRRDHAARRIVKWWRIVKCREGLRLLVLRRSWRKLTVIVRQSTSSRVEKVRSGRIDMSACMSSSVAKGNHSVKVDQEHDVIVQLQQQNARLENEIVRLQDLFINAGSINRRENRAADNEEEDIHTLRRNLRDLNNKYEQLESMVEDATLRSSCRSSRYPFEYDNCNTMVEQSDQNQPNVDFILRNIQQQMDLLRASVDTACKRGSRPRSSWTSSHPTVRSSLSSISYGGALNDMMHDPCGIAVASFERPHSMPLMQGPRSAPAILHHAPVRICRWARSAYCFDCGEPFTIFTWRHHCRMCGNSFCHEHSSRRITVLGIGFDDEPVRVCDGCFKQVNGLPGRDTILHSQRHYPSSSAGSNHLSDQSF